MNDQPAQPVVSYPCDWDYTVIAEGKACARNAVTAAAGSRKHSCSEATPSRNGKYTSLRISVHVQSQSERDSIFAMLKNSDGVKMVM